MARHEVRVDYARSLLEEPGTGHNRWHPDIPPVVTCDPGDEVVLQTRDAFDGQMGPEATLETVGAPNLNVVHPLTGPVYVNGAEPGDLLEVEILEVEPDRYAYTVQVPGFGFLRDEFPDPYMARWRIEGGWATSDDLPGLRIPGSPFMGTIGLAPDRALMERTTDREQAALDRGGVVLPPDPTRGGPAAHRRRPRRRAHRRRGPAHHPAPGDGRQRRHQAARRRRPALHPGVRPGWALLGRRRPLRPGRLRDLWPRHRDALASPGPLRRPQGPGRGPRH